GDDEDRIFGLVRAALAPGRQLDWKEEARLKGRGALPLSFVPTIVTFQNAADPKTVRIVPIDQLADVFGRGYALKSAYLETVGEAGSRVLRQYLPWLPHPSYLSGRFGCAPQEPHCLHGGNFER